jgi:hypothetical protein
VIWMVRKIVLHLTMESGRPPSDARPVSESERIRTWKSDESALHVFEIQQTRLLPIVDPAVR